MASARWNRLLFPAALAALALPPVVWLASRQPPRWDRTGAAEADEWHNRATSVLVARVRFKEGLANEVVQGTLHLREAAARLRDYHDVEPKVRGVRSGPLLAAQFPGATEEERYAGLLAFWVRNWAASDPDSLAGSAWPRVQRELAESYGRGVVDEPQAPLRQLSTAE